MRNQLLKTMREIKGRAQEIIKHSSIWKELNLDQNNLRNPKQFFQKRKELQATIDLLRLNNLNPRLIATNQILETGKKKDNVTLLKTIENLQKYFHQSALLQNLKGIEGLLKEKQDINSNKRLAIFFTDDPEILWQVGKYPRGCGSCQNYAEGSYAENLMGYVGDANVKVAYIVDLNKLPNELKDKLNEQGLEAIKDQIKNHELLETSLARSLIKIAKNENNQPVILFEPTYTKLNKSDLGQDKYFNLFMNLMVAEPMNVQMARGGGKERVFIGKSRSPMGQYEDLNLSAIKFIKKTHRPSKKEKEIIEKTKNSSNNRNDARVA